MKSLEQVNEMHVIFDASWEKVKVSSSSSCQGVMAHVKEGCVGNLNLVDPIA